MPICGGGGKRAAGQAHSDAEATSERHGGHGQFLAREVRWTSSFVLPPRSSKARENQFLASRVIVATMPDDMAGSEEKKPLTGIRGGLDSETGVY